MLLTDCYLLFLDDILLCVKEFWSRTHVQYCV